LSSAVLNVRDIGQGPSMFGSDRQRNSCPSCWSQGRIFVYCVRKPCKSYTHDTRSRNRRRLEHCSIPSQKVACTWLKWWLMIGRPCLHFNVFPCCNLITNYEFMDYSHVYFGRQKFLFQTHMVLRKNRRQKWSRFMATVTGACVMCITLEEWTLVSCLLFVTGYWKQQK